MYLCKRKGSLKNSLTLNNDLTILFYTYRHTLLKYGSGKRPQGRQALPRLADAQSRIQRIEHLKQMYREATTCEQGQGRIPSHASLFYHDSKFIVLILPHLLPPLPFSYHNTHAHITHTHLQALELLLHLVL